MTNETPPTVSLAEGWAIVPVDPTEAMLEAAAFYGKVMAGDVWSEMLSASPAHTPAPDTRLPEGMVPWAGGDAAPVDWDGGPVMVRKGITCRPVEGSPFWDFGRSGRRETNDYIAYTPHPAVEVTEKRADVLPYLESEARRFAGFYPEGSDGRNTFIIFADKIAASASTTEDGV